MRAIIIFCCLGANNQTAAGWHGRHHARFPKAEGTARLLANLVRVQAVRGQRRVAHKQLAPPDLSQPAVRVPCAHAGHACWVPLSYKPAAFDFKRSLLHQRPESEMRCAAAKETQPPLTSQSISMPRAGLSQRRFYGAARGQAQGYANNVLWW